MFHHTHDFFFLSSNMKSLLSVLRVGFVGIELFVNCGAFLTQMLLKDIVSQIFSNQQQINYHLRARLHKVLVPLTNIFQRLTSSYKLLF